MGERSPLALLNPAASSRMAVGEAITNIAAARIHQLSDIKLSANWMAACGEEGQDAALFDAVEAIGLHLCPTLGLAIPVGKDSLSMRVSSQQNTTFSPVSCIISAFAPVKTLEGTLTPELQAGSDTVLWLLDLGEGKQRLGGSIYAQTLQQMGQDAPDVDNPIRLKHFFDAIQALQDQNLLLAYHDKSDGGLWVTLCEMSFSSHLGFDVTVSEEVNATLFNEELGAVIQIKRSDEESVHALLAKHHLTDITHPLGHVTTREQLVIRQSGETILELSRVEAQQAWRRVSYEMQALRDNKACADEAYTTSLQYGLKNVHCAFSPTRLVLPVTSVKPTVAILREQGVNGHAELAAAFMQADFEAVDVHMSDLIDNPRLLAAYQGLAAPGGFSFGDVLGAGGGWAKGILYQEALKEAFFQFFHRPNTFALGICNGCQMLSQLKLCIPGADNWPLFVKNTSEQFEARLVKVILAETPSVFFTGMAGSILPIVVAHGEGRVVFKNEAQVDQAQVVMRYVDDINQPTMQYPSNPNGSLGGIAGLTNQDGRVTILMPHPERVIRTNRLSWAPKIWQETYSPWMRMFDNVRNFVR